ncbi:MAG: nuclease [Zetaproteobacteria bacterium CG_4_9_14_3_um_filter_49_83]|nr:MAG: nuclease [Zetaproteobacteria bacterium CG1_02_49_23]PIQ34679.1 MAG: nuclease [Zetaproteobacteria bacterium CG17_big_fil_post_rev_8_21_14_2_50_50_13]PIY54974.1 MAG: nuclease [Zetaproteobacteria bacterium CG_4_10_14_0_8_um_filter_49_80]PJA34262.1 MAG: nuclease [Zetaproteobacteria bacterium CG_4_9_14_3_um_filter_49_83]
MTHLSSLFSQLIASYWWLLPLLMILGLLKSPWFKGIIGEAMVNRAVQRQLDKVDYHLIKNVTFPTTDGTTQIDHIIVSRFGVFVVETKNMKGWIFGGKHQKIWTQKTFRSRSKFQNPLHQNHKHTKALETALGIASGKLFSVIVFVGDSTFKSDMPENVTSGADYIPYIKSKTKVLLTASEVQQAIEHITDGRLQPSIGTSRQHASHVREIVTAKAEVKSRPPETASTKACPKCGSDMVLRTSLKGPHAGSQFWGCSTFPKCRTISDIG